nr:propionate catabolism operon regulatory protein PrpR [uncultured Roseateles sp.]
MQKLPTGPLPRICVIGYKGLTRVVHSVLPEYVGRAEIEVIDEVFEQANLAAKQRERDRLADVFISAGANASILKSTLATPVAVIKVSGYDILVALLRARQISERVGLVTYRDTVPELASMKALLNLDIDQLAYQTADEARDCFMSLAAAGHTVIVGSSVVVELAEQRGIHGILTYSAAAVRLALDDALELAHVSRLEAGRHERLHSVLQHLQEAVLATDEEGRITAVNPPMEQLLGLPAPDAVGKLLSNLAPTLSLKAVLDSGRDEIAQVIEFRQRPFIANRIAIRERGGLAGAVLTLYDAKNIRNADTRLRVAARSRKPVARYFFDQIAGASPALVRTKAMAKSYAATGSTVLLTGESGTGKELFAQAIHNASPRNDKPFVAINCAAFPEPLLESELFGYEEGAFTGSRKGGKAGLFEVAHTGTVFLDEIGDMPLSLQTRLLRVLQEKEVVRLGSTDTIPVDVRIISATHQPLMAMVRLRQFREDLYYRLNILNLHLPPLRERAEDIPVLAEQLLQAALQRLGLPHAAEAVIEDISSMLCRYQWPGNVRELENVVERLAVFLSAQPASEAGDQQLLRVTLPELFENASEADSDARAPLSDQSIRDALAASRGNRHVAAQRLGISRTTLWRRLRAMS